MSKKDKKKEHYKKYMSKPGVREKRLNYYKQYYLDNKAKRQAYFKEYNKKRKALKEVSDENTDNL